MTKFAIISQHLDLAVENLSRNGLVQTSITGNYYEVIIMFIEKPASKSSISKRKPIYGIGINDAHYNVTMKVGGKYIMCPYYQKWLSMLQRCYCKSFQKRRPTYKGCAVCDAWLLFSNFKFWMEGQDWKGKQIDKDILFQGNKVYSPDKCLFVTLEINSLMAIASNKGGLPIGVYPSRKSYKTACMVNGKSVHIGVYKTQEQAFEAYKAVKYKEIRNVAIKQVEPLMSALLRYVIPSE